MFPLPMRRQPRAAVTYEPPVSRSFCVRARQRGCSALEATVYDFLAAGDGSNLDPLPDLQLQRRHPRGGGRCSPTRGRSSAWPTPAHIGHHLRDAGATRPSCCSPLVRDRAEGRLPLEHAVHMLTRRNTNTSACTIAASSAPECAPT
jgi:hypothetical protein